MIEPSELSRKVASLIKEIMKPSFVMSDDRRVSLLKFLSEKRLNIVEAELKNLSLFIAFRTVEGIPVWSSPNVLLQVRKDEELPNDEKIPQLMTVNQQLIDLHKSVGSVFKPTVAYSNGFKEKVNAKIQWYIPSTDEVSLEIVDGGFIVVKRKELFNGSTGGL